MTKYQPPPLSMQTRERRAEAMRREKAYAEAALALQRVAEQLRIALHEKHPDPQLVILSNDFSSKSLGERLLLKRIETVGR